jgi:aerobic-type carbon monoxide dehydrogenase small subunit (CoxS/CutS family)
LDPVSRKTITVDVNGERYERELDARRLLIHFIRDDLDLTGSHIGCDTGNCGACSVLIDGTLVKSCMMLAVQADGAKIETVEGLAADGELNGLQQAFSDHHALQCGYCTPGMLITAAELLGKGGVPTRETIRAHISGNYCRCTGYHAIVDAVEATVRARAGEPS